MKYTACLLVGIMCLLLQNTAYSQAKLNNLRAFDGYNGEGEPVEIVIDFSISSPADLGSVAFTVYQEADVELLSYSLTLRKEEDELYLSDGTQHFRIYQNGVSLSIALPSNEHGQWSHVLLQGISGNGELLNSLLSHNENL